MDITSDIHNNRYFQNPREIKEIDIKNIPKDILLKNKTKNRHQRNKLKNIPQKINSSFSSEKFEFIFFYKILIKNYQKMS